MAGHSVAVDSPRVLREHHCLGIRHSGAALVGGGEAASDAARVVQSLQRRKAHGCYRPHAFLADVACRVPCGWWGVVPDVAVTKLQRTGGIFSDVCGGWNCSSAPAASGFRGPTLTATGGAVTACVEPHTRPGLQRR